MKRGRVKLIPPEKTSINKVSLFRIKCFLFVVVVVVDVAVVVLFPFYVLFICSSKYQIQKSKSVKNKENIISLHIESECL